MATGTPRKPMSDDATELNGDTGSWRVAARSTILRIFVAFGVVPALWSVSFSLSIGHYLQASETGGALALLMWAAFAAKKSPSRSASISVGVLLAEGFTTVLSQGLTANVAALLVGACMLALLTLGPRGAIFTVSAASAAFGATAIAIGFYGWAPPTYPETAAHAFRSLLIFLGFGGGSVAAVHHIIERLEGTTAALRERTLALRRSEAEFRALFDNVFEGVFRAAHRGPLLMANRALTEMLGYASPDELLHGHPSRDIFVRAADQEEVWQRLDSDGELRNTEIRVKRKDGRELYLLVNARAVRNAAGDLSYEGTVVDITERKQLEEQLVQARKMEAIGRLAGGVAHDFNNLLTIILGYAEILHESLSRPVDRHQLESITAAASSAADLTRQLLAFSRKQILAPQTLDLNAIVTKTLAMLRRVLGENIVVETSLVPRLDPVLADPGQLEQVIVNLCVNARDAMPGGGRLTIATANVDLNAADTSLIEGLAPGPHVRLSVGDTGAGMDSALQARIFEPFFSTKEPSKGTGLGLATVYGIVRQSGGSVSVQSQPGAGTTFTIYLPRAEAAAAEPPSLEAAASRRGSETILIVEDDRDVRSVMSVFLRQHGYTVLEAASGLEALRLCQRHPRLDLVITDVIMPMMGGTELAARLATSQPLIRVLMMSGYTDDGAPRGALEPGRGILQKPFTRTSLLGAVRRVLDEASPARST
jgi:two-component system cell cycle sensor histidine kinase/response regulator CckA